MNYNNLANTALNKLKEFGTQVKQIRQNETVWEMRINPTSNTVYWINVDNGQIVTEEPVIEDQVILGYGILSNFTEENRVNFMINEKDVLLSVAGILPPESGDIFQINGNNYSYVNHKNIQPADTVLMYKVQITAS